MTTKRTSSYRVEKAFTCNRKNNIVPDGWDLLLVDEGAGEIWCQRFSTKRAARNAQHDLDRIDELNNACI